MTYKSLLSKAIHIAKTHKSEWVNGFFIAFILRLIAAAPLMALFTPYKEWAMLSPVIFLFGVMPLRFSMAERLNALVAGGRFFDAKLVSFENYFGKLRKGMWQGIKLLVYGIGVIAFFAYLGQLWGDTTDGFKIIRWLIQLGGGSVDTGILVLIGVCLVLCIPVLIGMGVNCADRFVFMLGRKMVKGERKRYFKSGLLNFCLLLPSIACVVAGILVSLLPAINALSTKALNLPLSGALILIAICLYIPTLPIRKLLTPIMVQHNEA